jgi:uracil-DNA glycosylase
MHRMPDMGSGNAPGKLPASWRAKLGAELAEPYFRDLSAFLATERAEHEVFPPEDEVFTALELTPFHKVRVVLLGQDPYHDAGQAHGLCFSVKQGVKPPPSLVNMFKELESDLGLPPPAHGCLEAWARQGVLLLNAVLTVRAHEPNSHKNKGWERFTDAVVRAVSARPDPVVFALWGGYAQKKGKIVDDARHTVLTAAHPSPLSARRFLGSRPFSAINAVLAQQGKAPIDWQLT